MTIERLIKELLLGSDPVTSATFEIAAHEFVPPGPENVAAMRSGLQELINDGLENIDTLFLVGLLKNPSDHKCQDCGESHANNVQLFTLASGNPIMMQAALIVAVDNLQRQTEESMTAALENEFNKKEGHPPH
jgi:hypothetical protein